MQDNLKTNLLKVCCLFEKNNVNYMVVGGTAVELEGTQIHVISYSDLIEDKKSTARKKDLEDIEQLRINRKED